MDIQPWKEISRENVFSKYGRKINKIVYELPNGQKSDYYIKEERYAAAIVALTKNNEVLMVKEFRPAQNKIMLGIPGGFIDPNETPEQAIARELLEETGYQGHIKFLAECIYDAYWDFKRYAFLATDCQKVQEAKTDENEHIVTDLISIDEFKKLARSGQMIDFEVGLLALDKLGLLK